jgi:hypothetical protein
MLALALAPVAASRAQQDAIWIPKRVAELQMLDKVTARVSVIRVPVDRPAQFGTLTIRVAACFARPPDEVPDASAWMEIADSRRAAASPEGQPREQPRDQLVFRGWMFADAPGVSMLEHPVYDVRVLSCRDG